MALPRSLLPPRHARNRLKSLDPSNRLALESSLASMLARTGVSDNVEDGSGYRRIDELFLGGRNQTET